MCRLEYDRCGAQGMDWGSIISPEVGRFDGAHVIGVHVSEIFSFPSGDPAELEALTEQEKKQWQTFQWWIENKGAYNPLQSTLPQTLAHALADSTSGPACLERRLESTAEVTRTPRAANGSGSGRWTFASSSDAAARRVDKAAFRPPGRLR
jgi:hypothetical protein